MALEHKKQGSGEVELYSSKINGAFPFFLSYRHTAAVQQLQINDTIKEEIMFVFLHFCAALVATRAFRLPQFSNRAMAMITRATTIKKPKTTTKATTVKKPKTTISGLNIKDMFANSSPEVNNKLLTMEAGGMPLPSWLNGALLRNGPGLFETEKRRFGNIFDGLAKLTRYDVKEDGSVRFSTRFLRSKMYETMTDEGDISPGPYTGPVIPSFNRMQKIQGAVSYLSSFDNVVVNVHQMGDTKGPWVATTDSPVLMEFDPFTLQTIGKLKAKGSSSILQNRIESPTDLSSNLCPNPNLL